jgi:hypothetical protein
MLFLNPFFPFFPPLSPALTSPSVQQRLVQEWQSMGLIPSRQQLALDFLRGIIPLLFIPLILPTIVDLLKPKEKEKE